MGRGWIQPSVGAVAAFVLYMPFLFLKYFEFESLFYLLAAMAVTVAVGLALIVRGIAFKSWPGRWFLISVAIFWAVSISEFLRTEDLRPRARWITESRSYKDMVLRQNPDPISGLRHAEWDGWGWAGMDTSVELVYDPTDSLAKELSRNPKGRYAELAAKAADVKRLSRCWYSVTLFTNEAW